MIRVHELSLTHLLQNLHDCWQSLVHLLPYVCFIVNDKFVHAMSTQATGLMAINPAWYIAAAAVIGVSTR